MFRRTFLSLVTAASLMGGSVAQAETGTIMTTLTEAGDFSTFVAALKSAGLEALLQGPGPFTVFAPKDTAFEAMSAAERQAFLSSPSLKAAMSHHVVPGRLSAAELSEVMMAPTVTGDAITFAVSGGVTVEGILVSAADITASNGVIHALDGVLTPPVK